MSILPRKWLYKAPANDEFTVMQFNCLADGLAQTGDFAHCTPEELAWEPRWALMQEEIALVQPDVLFVQEMNHPEALAQLLPDHQLLFCPKLNSPAQKCGAPPDGCAMLLRRSYYEVLDVQVMYFQMESGLNSGAIVVAARDKRNSQGVVFSTTHLKAKAAQACEDLRCQQMQQLLTRVRGSRLMLSSRLDGAQDALVVLGGDFNSAPGRDVYSAVYGEQAQGGPGPGLDFYSLYNSTAVGPHVTSPSRPGCDEVASGNAYSADDAGETKKPPVAQYALGEPAFSTFKIRRGEGEKRHLIDYLWLSGGPSCVLSALWSLPTAAEVGAQGLPCPRYPSDHLAMAVKLGWRNLL